ncbi:MAG: hypothetical protein WDA18_08290 [Candidatus Ratteibacteria bacterium]
MKRKKKGLLYLFNDYLSYYNCYYQKITPLSILPKQWLWQMEIATGQVHTARW